MKLSTNGRRELKNAEGLCLIAYHDVTGVLTIGYGHVLKPGEAKNLTKLSADELLTKDLERYEDEIHKDVHVALNQNQYDALVLFVYNVGIGAFRGSTLLKELNAGRYDHVAAQFTRWVHDRQGNTITGLVNRRSREIKLWQTPVP